MLIFCYFTDSFSELENINFLVTIYMTSLRENISVKDHGSIQLIMGPFPEPCVNECVYISGWTLQHGRRRPLGVGPLVSMKGRSQNGRT